MESFPNIMKNGDISGRDVRTVHSDVINLEPKNAATSRSSIVPANDSPAEEASTSSNDVGALVAKSKKAATTLWTLLHAKVRKSVKWYAQRNGASCSQIFVQNCRLPVTRCSHLGCGEAKLIYLHLKTCSAGPGSLCPTKHKGCDDSRKLLAHYRRCREIRARQTGQANRQQQHACLVCSLVARHARNVLDRNRSVSPRKSNSKHLLTPAIPQLVRPRSTSPVRVNSKCIISNFSLSTEGKLVAQPAPSPQKMPPPPPRWKGNSKNGNLQNFSLSVESGKQPRNLNCKDSKVVARNFNCSGGFRPRAESLDIRFSSPVTGSHNNIQKPSVRIQHAGTSNFDASLPDDFTPEDVLEEYKGQDDPDRIRTRRRSMSCSVITAGRTNCDTVAEDPLEDLQQFLEGNP